MPKVLDLLTEIEPLIKDDKYKLNEDIPNYIVEFLDKNVQMVFAELKKAFPRKRTLLKIAQYITYRYMFWPGLGITMVPPQDTEFEYRQLYREKTLDVIKFMTEYKEYMAVLTIPPLDSWTTNWFTGWGIFEKEDAKDVGP